MVLGMAVGLGTGVEVAENRMKQTVPGPCFSQTSLSVKTQKAPTGDTFTPTVNPYQDLLCRGLEGQPLHPFRSD